MWIFSEHFPQRQDSEINYFNDVNDLIYRLRDVDMSPQEADRLQRHINNMSYQSCEQYSFLPILDQIRAEVEQSTPTAIVTPAYVILLELLGMETNFIRNFQEIFYYHQTQTANQDIKYFSSIDLTNDHSIVTNLTSLPPRNQKIFKKIFNARLKQIQETTPDPIKQGTLLLDELIDVFKNQESIFSFINHYFSIKDAFSRIAFLSHANQNVLKKIKAFLEALLEHTIEAQKLSPRHQLLDFKNVDENTIERIVQDFAKDDLKEQSLANQQNLLAANFDFLTKRYASLTSNKDIQAIVLNAISNECQNDLNRLGKILQESPQKQQVRVDNAQQTLSLFFSNMHHNHHAPPKRKASSEPSDPFELPHNHKRQRHIR